MENWHHCYRAKPYFRNVGVACTVGVLAIGLFSVIAAFFNLDGSFPNPDAAALVLALFWLGWFLLGLWLIAFYYKYRLDLGDNSLRQRGVLRDKQIDLRFVEEIRWRRFPQGGSVRLSGDFGVLKIELGTVSNLEREQVIAFLRDTIPENLHVGWEKFQAQFTVTPEKRRRSRRALRRIALFFAAHAVILLVIALIWRKPGLLVPAIVSGVLAPSLYFSSRKQREDADKSAVPD